MDEFGVQGSLKDLAKIPDLPETDRGDSGMAGPGPPVVWLRTQLKSVESAEEQSAFGLSEVEGVIVVAVGRRRLPGESGLIKGDVIIKAEGNEIMHVKDFLKTHKENNDLDSLSLIVVRNQSELAISINVK